MQVCRRAAVAVLTLGALVLGSLASGSPVRASARTRQLAAAAHGKPSLKKTVVRSIGSAAVPDPFEDADDNPATGTILNPDSPSQSHSIDSASDVDFFRVTVAATGRITITATDPNPLVDPVVLLFDSAVDAGVLLTDPANAAPIALDDDGGPGRSSQLVTNTVPAGTYFLAVIPFNYPDGDPIDEYEIAVASGTPAPPAADGFEPDDDTATAKAIVVDGAAQLHSIHTVVVEGDDLDAVTFSLRKAVRLRIATANAGDEDDDTVLTLFRVKKRRLVQVAANDDVEGGADRYAIIETTRKLPKGNYILAVTSFQSANEFRRLVFGYSLGITTLPRR